MKKSTLTAALLAAMGMTAAPAALAEGFYVQGDIGLANLRAKTELKDFNSYTDLKNNYKESGFMPRLSAGYDFGSGLRVAGDYTHYKKAETSSANAGTSTQARGIGVSAIYDIPVGLVVRPYVGARVALNKVKQEASAPGYSSKTSETKLSPGLMAGVGYQIDRNVALDAGYRYNHLDKKLKAHEASVGVRYTFQ